MKIQPCSILLPIYNGSQFLKQSIDSNLKTMRTEDELVVVNDGSTDITTKDLTDWEKYDSRIRVINRKHFGLVSSLNFGISICSNEYIARSDVDDIYRPDRIAKQVRYLESNPNCGAVLPLLHTNLSKNGATENVIPFHTIRLPVFQISDWLEKTSIGLSCSNKVTVTSSLSSRKEHDYIGIEWIRKNFGLSYASFELVRILKR